MGAKLLWKRGPVLLPWVSLVNTTQAQGTRHYLPVGQLFEGLRKGETPCKQVQGAGRKTSWELLKTLSRWDFLGGPVVKNLPCNSEDVASFPAWGTKMLHAPESPCALTTEPVSHSYRAYTPHDAMKIPYHSQINEALNKKYDKDENLFCKPWDYKSYLFPPPTWCLVARRCANEPCWKQITEEWVLVFEIWSNVWTNWSHISSCMVLCCSWFGILHPLERAGWLLEFGN